MHFPEGQLENTFPSVWDRNREESLKWKGPGCKKEIFLERESTSLPALCGTDSNHQACGIQGFWSPKSQNQPWDRLHARMQCKRASDMQHQKKKIKLPKQHNLIQDSLCLLILLNYSCDLRGAPEKFVKARHEGSKFH